jgi:hypothetical protein
MRNSSSKSASSRSSRHSRNHIRRSLILASVAASAIAGQAHAQSWTNAAGGNWSLGTNWSTPPVAGATTALTFGLASLYTATNDLTAFSLNSITFTNSGAIVIPGNQLFFLGTNPSITRNGNANATIAAPVNFASTLTLGGTGAATTFFSGAVTGPSGPTSGGVFRVNSATSPVSFSNSLNTYGLRVSIGSTDITAGTYTLTSTQRGNDIVGSVNDGGFWSLVVGDTAGQSATFRMLGGTMTAEQGFAANVTGSTGNMLYSGSTTVATFNPSVTGSTGRWGVNYGTGSIGITSGATVNARLAEIGRHGGSNSILTISGSNSRLNAAQMVIARTGVDAASSPVGATAVVTISNGGSFVSPGSGVPALPIGAIAIGLGNVTNGTLTVRDSGSFVAVNPDFVTPGGPFGGQTTIGETGLDTGAGFAGARGTLNVQDGGLYSTFTLFTAVRDGAVGTINLSGAGATMNVNAVAVLSGGDGSGSSGGLTTLNVSTGSIFNAGDLNASQNGVGSPSGLGQSVINVNGGVINTVPTAQPQFTATGQLAMSFTNFSSTTMTVDLGGAVSVNGSMFTSISPGSTSNINVTGNSRLIVSGLDDLLVTSGGGAGNGGTTTLTVQGGSLLQVPDANLGQNVGGNSVTTITGANSRFNATIAGTTSQIIVGLAGTAVLNFDNSATGNWNGNAFVAIDPGSSGTMNLSNSSSVNISNALILGGSGTVNGGAATVNVQSGASLTVNTFIDAFASGRMNVTGANSRVHTGVLFGDPGSQYNVSNNGTLSVSAMSVDTLSISSGGRAIVRTNGTNSGTSIIRNLNIPGGASPTGQLDLNDNDAVMPHAPGQAATALARTRELLRAGFNGGAWNGNGIASTEAGVTPRSDGFGYASNGTQLGNLTSFSGVTGLTGDEIIIRFTYMGDANLDGQVNGLDFNLLAPNFGQPGVFTWIQGDFNYDGIVNGLDFNLLAPNFGLAPFGGDPEGGVESLISMIRADDALTNMMMADQGDDWEEVMRGVAALGRGAAAVPEPSTLAALGAVAGLMLVRRRRTK